MASSAPETPRRRLIVCEEALKDFNGHWYEYDKAVVEMNRAEGVEVTVLAHRELIPEIAREINAVPFFSHTNWDGLYYHPRAWRRYLGILRHNWRMWRAMSRYFRQQAGTVDLVFVPTVVIFHLLAWWFLAWRFGGGRKVKRIVLLIRNSATHYEADKEIQFSQSARILGAVLKAYQPWTKTGRVVFTTDSHRLADEYDQLAGLPMTVLPHPCSLVSPPAVKLSGAKAAGTFTLMSPGPARWEKGAHLLLEALKAPKLGQVRCRMQWPGPVFSPSGTEVKPNPGAANIEILGRPLSSEAYAALLAEADAVVLPYLREAYYARISGVAVEAMLMGIPLIYSQDTWVSSMVSEYGAGLGFPSGDIQALSECIWEMSQNPVKWKALAVEKRSAARAHFSPANFQSGLWGVTQTPAP